MRAPRTNKKEFYRAVFRQVMARYDEYKATEGTNSCEPFYNALASDGVNGGKHNPRIVKVTPTDFVCDVELTAKRTLSPEEHRFFKLVYISKDLEMSSLAGDQFKALKRAIQEKLGFAFIAAKIHPVFKYLKPRDLR